MIIQDKTKIHEYVKLQEDSLKRSCAQQPHKAGSDGPMASGQLLQSLAATVSHKRLLSQKSEDVCWMIEGSHCLNRPQ